jgi:hypothetical protein
LPASESIGSGAGCLASAGIAATLGGVAASQGQSSVDNFCSQLNTGVGDVDAIKSWLTAAGIGADLVSDIFSLGLGPLVSVAQCACDLESLSGNIMQDCIAFAA